jgi:hypothetical protein
MKLSTVYFCIIFIVSVVVILITDVCIYMIWAHVLQFISIDESQTSAASSLYWCVAYLPSEASNIEH